MPSDKTVRFSDSVMERTFCADDTVTATDESSLVLDPADEVVPEDIMVQQAAAADLILDEEEEIPTKGGSCPPTTTTDADADLPPWLSKVAQAHPWLIAGTAIGGGIVTWAIIANMKEHQAITNIVSLFGLLLLLVSTVFLLIRSGQLKPVPRIIV